jgi:outer membrane lipoprotein-sorting protein
VNLPMIGNYSASKLFCLISLLSFSVDAGQEELLKKLEAEFSKIKTVQTEFKQEKALKIFKRVITMDGSITLENPGRMAWRIDSPIRYALVLNGDTAIQWDEDSNKIQKQKTSGDPIFEEVIGQIEKWFSGEFKSLLNDYDLTIESEAPPVLRFVPKAGSMVGKVIQSVTISARADLTYVEKIVIEDMGGDTTSIRFFNTVLNEPVPVAAWEVKRDG